MLSKFGDRFSRFAYRCVPDPFIIAIFLTALVFFGAWICTPSSFLEIFASWRNGFWSLLEFAMQMCLILVSGHALATSRPIHTVIVSLSRYISSPRVAVFVVALCTMITGLIHWGLGLIVGALLARTIGEICYKNKVLVHYPLLGASGYLGLMVWHGGLSGSVPLLVATKGHFMANTIGVIPLADTLFSSLNLIANGLMLCLIPFLAAFLHPSKEESMRTINEFISIENEDTGEKISKSMSSEQKQSSSTLVERLTDSRLISLTIAFIGLFLSIYFFIKEKDNGFHLNSVNWFFLFLALLFQKTPGRFLKAVNDGATGCAGIILQFPFYSGIMGVMQTTGLAYVLSYFFQSIASAKTLPLFTLLFSSLLNLFIPSGGGKWAVEGPIWMDAAQEIGSSLKINIMAYAYGDQLTNMLQPFWALALLGITQLKARDIIGYSALLMIAAFVICGGAVFFASVW